MKNKSFITVLVATFYLVLYIILLRNDVAYPLVYTMFALSPVVVLYMAYAILKFDVYNGPDLKEEEWGYLDYDPYEQDRPQDGDLIKLK